LKKTKISIFGGILEFLELIVFGQILAIFGSFGRFWVDSATMAVVDSMPSFERKKKENVITFAKAIRILCVMDCWKALLISHPQNGFKKSNYKLES
jgi:succinate-acetate transporter protein